jgi:hypothetical protein
VVFKYSWCPIFRGDDCENDHCVVVAEVRHRLSVTKQAKRIFDMVRFNLKKLNDRDVKRLKFLISLQLLIIWMMMRTPIGLENY